MNEEISYCNCAAHCCPAFGALSRSTSGSTEWYCAYHFGAPAARWGEITRELNRLGWIVKATRELRGWLLGGGGFGDWEAAFIKTAKLNQSSHLIRGDHESLTKWLARLEKTLADSCKEPAQQPLAQQGE